MITFKKGGYINEVMLNKEEAVWFITFLRDERIRHIAARQHAEYRMYLFRDIPVSHIAWRTSVERHNDDIAHIDKTIAFLRGKFDIKGD